MGEVLPVQSTQPDRSGLEPAGQIGECGGDRRIRGYLLLTEGHHKQHRVTLELPYQVAQQQHRGRIRPMRIVQHDHQAALTRDRSKKRRHCVEELKAGLPAVIDLPAGGGWSGRPRAPPAA
jgi:hypothetical protein